MVLTEDEAKTKECRASYDVDAGYYRNCLASECMQWAWKELPDAFPNDEPTGHCGLCREE